MTRTIRAFIPLYRTSHNGRSTARRVKRIYRKRDKLAHHRMDVLLCTGDEDISCYFWDDDCFDEDAYAWEKWIRKEWPADLWERDIRRGWE